MIEIHRLPNSGTVALVGVPYDENSSYLRGAAQAPAHIRNALHSESSNTSTENGGDLGSESRFVDVGDMDLPAGVEAIDAIRISASRILEKGACLISLGGDHSVTYPLFKAYSEKYGRINILHLDAHPDLYEIFDNNRYSHASPFARIMEEGLAKRLVQIGIRTINSHQRIQADRFGVEVIEMRRWRPDFRVVFDGPVYVSLDLDVLDPAFAPGISHYEPGGLTSRELIHLIQNLPAQVIGGDIVELNPTRDIQEMTAMVAAKLLKEMTAKILDCITTHSQE